MSNGSSSTMMANWRNNRPTRGGRDQFDSRGSRPAGAGQSRMNNGGAPRRSGGEFQDDASSAPQDSQDSMGTREEQYRDRAAASSALTRRVEAEREFDRAFDGIDGRLVAEVFGQVMGTPGAYTHARKTALRMVYGISAGGKPIGASDSVLKLAEMGAEKMAQMARELGSRAP